MSNEPSIQRQVRQRAAAAPSADAAEPEALSEVARRAAELARIAQQAWAHCAQDVDIEAELEARRNAGGQ